MLDTKSIRTWQLRWRTREDAARYHGEGGAPYTDLPPFQATQKNAFTLQRDLNAGCPSVEWVLNECLSACPHCGFVLGPAPATVVNYGV